MGAQSYAGYNIRCTTKATLMRLLFMKNVLLHTMMRKTTLALVIRAYRDTPPAARRDISSIVYHVVTIATSLMFVCHWYVMTYRMTFYHDYALFVYNTYHTTRLFGTSASMLSLMLSADAVGVGTIMARYVTSVQHCQSAHASPVRIAGHLRNDEVTTLRY